MYQKMKLILSVNKKRTIVYQLPEASFDSYHSFILYFSSFADACMISFSSVLTCKDEEGRKFSHLFLDTRYDPMRTKIFVKPSKLA